MSVNAESILHHIQIVNERIDSYIQMPNSETARVVKEINYLK